jgi:hypothetical protein
MDGTVQIDSGRVLIRREGMEGLGNRLRDRWINGLMGGLMSDS